MGRYVSIAGVLIGGISDVMLTNILVFPIIIILSIPLYHGAQTNSTAVSAQITATLQQPGWFALTTLLGAICSIIGGYIAASIAKREELLNGILAAWLCIAFGIVGVFLAHDLAHRLLTILELPFSALLSGAGGYLRLRMVRSKKRVAA